ncbi:hypothetical protein [Nostoc sp.]|uniref:hypothetical protein n=1 Tax=Nostoc sp. TaxID=1180 RepID=UPI002FF6DDEA
MSLFSKTRQTHLIFIMLTGQKFQALFIFRTKFLTLAGHGLQNLNAFTLILENFPFYSIRDITDFFNDLSKERLQNYLDMLD